MVTWLGKTDFRQDARRFGMSVADRRAHMYVLGKTGTGKSTLLEQLVMQDVHNGHGLALLDPHGDLVDAVYAQVQDKAKVVFLDATDPMNPYGYNPIRPLPVALRPLAASGLLEVFKKLWDDAWGVRMEHIFRNCLMTLLDQPKATLADLLRLLSDKVYRAQAVAKVTNEHVKRFWLQEYEKYSYRLRADGNVPIQNKVGAFLAHPTLSRVLTQPQKNISLRQVMDKGQVLLVNLSKGKLGEDASLLLGGLLMTSLGLAAFSRADSPEDKRRDFFLYADEFQNFTTLSLVNMASELRKYHVGLVLAHQYLHQLDKDIAEAVIGNAGSLVCFRLGPQDAMTLEKEFVPVFDRYDLLNLPNYHVYLKLMIDGRPSRPFSARTCVDLAQ